MPKVKTSVRELREHRVKLKHAAQLKTLSNPSELYLCVLGNGAQGSPRCLYVFSDHSRYLFNCGEGTQRLAHEYKMKLSKLEHVFITHKSWKNLGGLLGLSLTIQDIGVPQITLHGPQDIENLYSATKLFIMTKDLKVEKRDYTDESFVDHCMTVDYVPIFSSLKKSSNGYQSLNSDDVAHRDKRLKIASADEYIEENYDVTVAYICKGHDKPGHLMIEKCLEMGVPKGPLLGELKNGKDVTLPSGTTVRSLDVISPAEPCPTFIVVECPNEDFLGPLINNERLRRYHQLQEDPPSETAALVVHFTPACIVKMDKYQQWMCKFPSSTHHFLLNEDCSSINSIAVHRIQHMLNLLNPRMFSLLHETEYKSAEELNINHFHQPKTLCKYFLRPSKGLDRSSEVNIESSVYAEEARAITGFNESLAALHMSLPEKAYQGIEYPEIAFLGTGSCIPNKVRNVSGILVHVSSNCSILLDCGEGSYNQLLRLYGHSATRTILAGICCIFISHLHADHHLGLVTLLKERRRTFLSKGLHYTPVTVIAPHFIKDWLLVYDQLFEPVASLYRFINNKSLKVVSNGSYGSDENNDLLNLHQDIQIVTVPVKHCPSAYGVVVHLYKKWKLVYSGDTIPCEALVNAGKDCDLLIHEATMEDDLEEEATLKMHSTTSQALDIARRMNAKYTILTHFSQRYAKVPIFNESFESHVGCAFDNMKVQPCELPLLSNFIPTLQILFAEHIEKLQEKGNKRKEKLKQISESTTNITQQNT